MHAPERLTAAAAGEPHAQDERPLLQRRPGRRPKSGGRLTRRRLGGGGGGGLGRRPPLRRRRRRPPPPGGGCHGEPRQPIHLLLLPTLELMQPRALWRRHRQRCHSRLGAAAPGLMIAGLSTSQAHTHPADPDNGIDHNQELTEISLRFCTQQSSLEHGWLAGGLAGRHPPRPRRPAPPPCARPTPQPAAALPPPEPGAQPPVAHCPWTLPAHGAPQPRDQHNRRRSSTIVGKSQPARPRTLAPSRRRRRRRLLLLSLPQPLGHPHPRRPLAAAAAPLRQQLRPQPQLPLRLPEHLPPPGVNAPHARTHITR
jgi:hypothetical protein